MIRLGSITYRFSLVLLHKYVASGYEHLFEWWKIKNKCCGRRRHHKLPEVDNPIPIGVKDVEDLDKMVLLKIK